MTEKINKYLYFGFIQVIIAFIGFIDYVTGSELSFSIFYLLPISLLALSNKTKFYAIIATSLFASVIWFFADFYTKESPQIFIQIWNSFVRFCIFSAIGLLIFYIKKKHIELNLMNKNLSIINEEKNKFIGIAAHDLRNPISGIYSISDLLITNYKPSLQSDVIELISMINTTSKNTLVVLHNLLDVSKIESGKIELKLKPQEYISFVKNIVDLNQVLANPKKIKISLQTQINDVVFHFDEHYLSEVLDNLLSNAMKFSPYNSEIIVKISTTNDDQILTEVIDNGKGIPKAEQDNLFKYFQTTSVTPTAGEQSTGLGLAVSKKIILLHGGEIGVESDQNQGSIFFFTLPK